MQEHKSIDAGNFTAQTQTMLCPEGKTRSYLFAVQENDQFKLVLISQDRDQKRPRARTVRCGLTVSQMAKQMMAFEEDMLEQKHTVAQCRETLGKEHLREALIRSGFVMCSDHTVAIALNGAMMDTVGDRDFKDIQRAMNYLGEIRERSSKRSQSPKQTPRPSVG